MSDLLTAAADLCWQLPLDLSSLSEEERLVRLQRRKPRQKVVMEQELEDTFDASQYQKFWKR